MLCDIIIKQQQILWRFTADNKSNINISIRGCKDLIRHD